MSKVQLIWGHKSVFVISDLKIASGDRLRAETEELHHLYIWTDRRILGVWVQG